MKRIILAIIFSTAVLYSGFSAASLRINYTASAPVGVWKVNHYDRSVRVGEYVEVCPPNVKIVTDFIIAGILARGQCPSGSIPLLKIVAATKGDHVLITDNIIKINEQVVGPILPAMPHQKGQFTVADNEVWLINTDNRSFDSRYYGPVNTANIIGIATPIFTREGISKWLF